MSESGHGSNVQNVQTTATYDPETQEFVVETPTEEDRKDYIGNAARDGRLAAVFCQLVVGGERARRPLRARPAPRRGRQRRATGVRIEDCGHKLGLNGVDNGRIYFDDVRVPRENLLDRYAQVSAEGEYYEPDREREPPLLHDARHADPGPHQRRRRLDQRHQGRR